MYEPNFSLHRGRNSSIGFDWYDKSSKGIPSIDSIKSCKHKRWSKLVKMLEIFNKRLSEANKLKKYIYIRWNFFWHDHDFVWVQMLKCITWWEAQFFWMYNFLWRGSNQINDCKKLFKNSKNPDNIKVYTFAIIWSVNVIILQYYMPTRQNCKKNGGNDCHHFTIKREKSTTQILFPLHYNQGHHTVH